MNWEANPQLRLRVGMGGDESVEAWRGKQTADFVGLSMVAGDLNGERHSIIFQDSKPYIPRRATTFFPGQTA